MANRAGYQVIGLPNYIVWHIDTEEKEGNLKYALADPFCSFDAFF